MKADKWLFISRKEVLSHPRMHLVEDTVKLPNSKKAEYLRHAPARAHSVAILAVNGKQELLLQKEYSYPPDEILWQLPGGGMLEGETAEEAGNRELAEESGFKARQVEEIGFFYKNSRRTDEKQYVILCSSLYEESADGDPEEFIESYWVSLGKVKAMIARGEFHNVNLLAALNLYFFKSYKTR